MSFIEKLIKKINGDAYVQTQPGVAPSATPVSPEDVSATHEANSTASRALDTTSQHIKADAETSENPETEKKNKQETTSEPTSQDTTAEDNKVEFDEKGLNSDSAAEQRIAWHRFLVSLLKSIKIDKPGNLRYFTVFIRQVAGVSYSWNDDSMKRELLKELERYDCASHIGNSTIGGGTFTIEVVNERRYKQESERQVSSNTQFRKVYKEKDTEIILFGSKKETTEQKFATAIDKRAFVINELLKKFRSSTGTDTKLMENLVIIVIRNEEDDDMAKYDWIGKRFEDDLKRELTNAFLEKIGSKSLRIILKPKSETEDCISLIDNQVYYKWGKADTSEDDKPKEIPYERVVASVSIIEGTGSMMKSSYVLDSDRKKIFHIGRGVTSRKGGKYRVNDIVIKDKEADHDLLECNAHVSSTHADIVFKNNKFYIKAAIGGCRAIGGSPTKLVRDEKATELRDTNLLYPLEDGDIIELGKNVLLVYSLTDDSSLPINFEKERPNNAMSIDDSF